MGDRKLTLLELHLHSEGDVQVGPEAIDTGGEAELVPTEETEGRGFPFPIPVLVVGGFAVLAAVSVIRRVMAEG